MRLKDKFKLPIDANNNINDYVADQCEKVADTYAIGFAEWLVKNYDGRKSVKELLEIYKKEKEL